MNDISSGVSKGLLKNKEGRKLSKSSKLGDVRIISIPGYLLRKIGLNTSKRLLGIWDAEDGERFRKSVEEKKAKVAVLAIWETDDEPGVKPEQSSG